MSTKNAKAIILVGGSSKGTRFRPLSFDLPKPLFPIGGEPMLTHHVAAACSIPSVAEILLLGFYPEKQFVDYMATTSKRFNVPIRYLAEEASLGTAGGLFKFREELLKDGVEDIFLMHVDVLCTFPLAELLQVHTRHAGMMTMLTKRLADDEAIHYGCLVHDPSTLELKHFAPRPETYVSSFINCGIYVVRAAKLHAHLVRAAATLSQREVILEPVFVSCNDPLLDLDRDIIAEAADSGEVFVHETKGFWCQLKHAGSVVSASHLLLSAYRANRPTLLATSAAVGGATLVGDVVVSPSAQVHPSAKLGPNVTIGDNVKIGPGVRVKNSIVLADTQLHERCCVLNSVIGRDCVVGRWARIEGLNSSPAVSHDKNTSGITIFGNDVSAAPEVVVRDCIVLPHKSLGESCFSEILL